jgi:hypothetical protein
VVVKVAEMIINLLLVMALQELVAVAVEPVELLVDLIEPLVVMVDQVLL